MFNSQRRLARRSLDARLLPYRQGDGLRPPTRGWIRALRDALGMTSSQLGLRIGVSAQAITGLEQSEAAGTAQLNTLRRAAEALDATLIYALVPNKPLEQMVQDRAATLARRAIERVDQTMRLEGQATDLSALEEAMSSYIHQLRDRELWDDR